MISLRRTGIALGYLIFPLALIAGCAGVTTEPEGLESPPALDALPRPLTSAEHGIIGSVNDFTFSLLKAVNTSADSNVFTSPLSASFALGMTMNGAAGSTYDQMRSALALGTMSEGDIDDGYRSLIALLRGLDPGVDVRIANSIWYDTRLPVEQGFVDKSRTYFDASVTGLAFADPASVTRVNGWVSGATAGRIPTIVDDLGGDLVMLLVNAIYFKGSWRERFDPALTIDAAFHGVHGDQPAKLMHRRGSMAYLGTSEFDAVDLPYGNSAFSMTVVLPRAGRNVEDVARGLQSAQWSTWMSQMHDSDVDLHLPRFTLEWARKMNGDLQSLGMRDAFVDGGADFSRLSPIGRQLFISYVKQKSFIEVNEEGTEAAAATAVGIGVTSAPQSVSMRVDRPFLLVIRERLTGTILFVGKIVRMP